MTEARPSAIVLSPHLDDAVFSCPGWIRQSAIEQEQPLVVTIFSHASLRTGTDAHHVFDQRQREDEEAVRLLGASRRLAGFAEASFRRSEYRRFSGLVCNQAREDEALTMRLRTYLQSLLEDLQPRKVLGPLGVGQHVDHRLLQEAVETVAPAYPNTAFAYYEDRPYAFVEEATRLRLGQLGRHADAPDFPDRSPASRSERYFLSFFGAPYAREHLGAGDQAYIIRHALEAFTRALHEPMNPAQSTILAWHADIVRDVLPALDAYTSQHRGFMGSPLYHQWVALEYARRLGYEGQYTERTWHW